VRHSRRARSAQGWFARDPLAAASDLPVCGILGAVTDREIKVPMLVVAVLCLLIALGGGALLFVDGGQTLGFALLGFFGAGAFVLGRKALGFS
jgi:hypothetical protein